jgi:hypothetical protein
MNDKETEISDLDTDESLRSINVDHVLIFEVWMNGS